MARRPVNLVEVNHISVQALEAVVAGADDVRRGQISAAAANPGHAARRTCHFGRQNQFAACRRIFCKPVAQDGFRGAKGRGSWRHRIHFCRIQKIDAALQRTFKNGMRRDFIDLFAKGHGAQADRGDMQIAAAELNFIHENFS